MKSNENYTSETAALYASLGVIGTTYQVCLDALAAEVNNLKNKHVLDFGCGAGRSTRLLQSFFPKQLVGIDSSPAMIEQALSQGYQNIQFQKITRGDALPFPTGVFDAAFAMHVYCEFSDSAQMEQATKELNRILKPEGILYVITTNPGCLGADFINYHYASDDTVKDGSPITCHVHTNPPFSINDTWWSLEKMEQIFRESGFEISKRLLPLATGTTWRDESKVAPGVLYCLTKLNLS